jgi:serine/threonine-protein kinase
MHPQGTPGQALGLPKVGHVLAGKYEIVRLMGEGGMAFIFEATHQRLRQRVAIKLLAPEFVRDAEIVARFDREARAVASLKTKHVARVIDVDATPEGTPFIVMEFLEGRDLDAELQARTRLPVGEAVDCVLQACAGMLEAHGQGIVHRDLKPANLFLATGQEGGDRILKVLDFGISKMGGDAKRLTSAGAVMGTVLYMSPEQVRADPTVDGRADIWALGVILFELVAGRAPWEGNSHKIAAQIVSETPPDLRAFAAVPDDLADTVRTMLQREPDRRFATLRDVIAALAQYAPMGSVGAGIAEQLAVAQVAGRKRGSGTVLPQRTMPMLGGQQTPQTPQTPYAPQAPLHTPLARSVSASLPGGLNYPTDPSMPSVPPPAGGGRPRGTTLLLVALGLLGAVGIVLIVLVQIQRARHPSPSADPAPPVSAGSPTAAGDASAPLPTNSGTPR